LWFDPDRSSEASVVAHWFDALRLDAPQLRCVGNQPYLGTDDGLSTALRQLFDARRYAGIELEIRQGLLLTSPEARHWLADVLANTLKQASARAY